MRLIDFINAGGSITWVLVAMNVLGLSLVLWRFFVVRDFKSKLAQEANSIADELSKDLKTKNLLPYIELVKDEVSRRVHSLETGLTSIKVVATTAPLLGLLGTVLGIYEAFQVISSQGLSDPGQFASGISYALSTPIVGLIVAIPHFVAHNYLSGELDGIELKLEKQMAPMLQGE